METEESGSGYEIIMIHKKSKLFFKTSYILLVCSKVKVQDSSYYICCDSKILVVYYAS